MNTTSSVISEFRVRPPATPRKAQLAWRVGSSEFSKINHMELKDSRSGFSLLEVLAAIGLVSIGLVAMLSLVIKTIATEPVLKNKIIATYLAQEGVEGVRNIRDSNWLKNLSWNNGLTSGEYRLKIDRGVILEKATDYNLYLQNDRYVHINTGASTPFSRTIILSEETNYLIVQSVVIWQGKGGSERTVMVEDRLFDWR